MKQYELKNINLFLHAYYTYTGYFIYVFVLNTYIIIDLELSKWFY